MTTRRERHGERHGGRAGGRLGGTFSERSGRPSGRTLRERHGEGHGGRYRGRIGGRRPAGQASLEYLGMLPFLLLIALAGIQLGIAAYCGSQAGTAARTAARTAALPDPQGGIDAGARAGEAAVSGWVHPDIGWPVNDAQSVTAEATVDIPSVLPGVHLFGPVHRDATMPKEDWTP
ncbi:TadE/TadG family type IV pilus assembly protein [Streptomyces sp. NPDC087270]|uniref:TadE/TadG family type IV pilus assembly protein n=1 Tax=Streptomyces sp. NPDC087270 TaxID=3365774 RepID=UPI003821A70A